MAKAQSSKIITDKADELEDYAADLSGVEDVLELVRQAGGEHPGALSIAQATVERINAQLGEAAVALRRAL